MDTTIFFAVMDTGEVIATCVASICATSMVIVAILKS
jgi:hypothetical protein